MSGMHTRLGVFNVDYWASLGWSDVRHRYRRTILGPFWLVAPLGVMVAAIGFLYSRIFEIPTAVYIPHLTLGLVLWTYISQAVVEGTGAFASYANIMHATHIQKSALISRVIFRHVIYFMHNLIVVAVVMIAFRIWHGWVSLAAILSVINATLVVLGACLALAPLSARYGDVEQITGALLQLMFFLTPILWVASESGARFWFYEYNPFYHLIEGFRAPLVSGAFELRHYLFGALTACIALAIGTLVFSRTHKRVTLWRS